MKQFISILSVTLLLSATSFAQKPFHFGVKLGANLSTFTPDDETVTSNSTVGYLGGLFFRFDLPKKLLIQPEVYFSYKKSEFETSYLGKNLTIGQDKYDIDAALLFGYRIIDNELFNFRVMAGPYNSTNVSSDVSVNYEEYESNKLGYQVGLGADITKLTVDLRYEGYFGEIQKDTKYSAIQLALGFKFL